MAKIFLRNVICHLSKAHCEERRHKAFQRKQQFSALIQVSYWKWKFSADCHIRCKIEGLLHRTNENVIVGEFLYLSIQNHICFIHSSTKLRHPNRRLLGGLSRSSGHTEERLTIYVHGGASTPLPLNKEEELVGQ